MKDYITVIGLEVHVQLNTLSKAFCADANLYGASPNTHISAVSLALPGTLPVLNVDHVRSSIKLAHALNSTINLENRFDRKNYFYPDLPKGYQITQDNLPICVGGTMKYMCEGVEKEVRIHHVHMEEDAGKNSHDLHPEYSLLDINRAGTPLVEIVTEPDFRSGQEVHDFIGALQQLVRYLEISDGNMEEGSMRCDVNVSVMPVGSKVYGERNEIKNVNSKKFAKTAVEYESQRQIKILESNGTIAMNTLLFDPSTGTTRPMRSKEEANDYRYFPDPDLPPVRLTQAYVNSVIEEVGLLPWTALEILTTRCGLSSYDAEILSRDKEVVEYFLKFDLPENAWSSLSNFIINKLIPYTSEQNISLKEYGTANISNFINLLESGNISKSAGLTALSDIVMSSDNINLNLEELAKKHNLIQSDNQDFLDKIIEDILSHNSDKVIAYNNGKNGLLGFFMGQVMSRAQGKANPQVLSEKLSAALEKKK